MNSRGRGGGEGEGRPYVVGILERHIISSHITSNHIILYCSKAQHSIAPLVISYHRMSRSMRKFTASTRYVLLSLMACHETEENGSAFRPLIGSLLGQSILPNDTHI
jgi:hypothetical protein